MFPTHPRSRSRRKLLSGLAYEKLQRLTLRLHTFTDCDAVEDPPTPAPDDLRHALLCAVVDDEAAGRRNAVVALLEQLRGLRSLQLDVVDLVREQDIFEPDPQCRCRSAVRAGIGLLGDLALPSLRELDLTLIGEGVGSSNSGVFSPGIPEPHVCPVINKLLLRLPGLKVVHLRLSTLCPAVFRERPGHAGTTLEKLHIDCDVWDLCEINQTLRCGAMGDYGESPIPRQIKANQLVRGLGAAAREFAGQPKSPKVFRVVWPDEVSFYAATVDAGRRSFAWDCLAGEARRFVRGAPWDSEGSPVDLDQEIPRMQREWDELNSLSDESIAMDPFD